MENVIVRRVVCICNLHTFNGLIMLGGALLEAWMHVSRGWRDEIQTYTQALSHVVSSSSVSQLLTLSRARLIIMFSFTSQYEQAARYWHDPHLRRCAHLDRCDVLPCSAVQTCNTSTRCETCTESSAGEEIIPNSVAARSAPSA